MASTIGRIWRSERFRAIFVVLLIAGVVFGLWYGMQAALNTRIVPVLAVVSGSMCIPERVCDGMAAVGHIFEPTLHRGDLIVIQGVKSADLNANYPDSDIIVFQDPFDAQGELIVHRIIAKTEVNGTLYFSTKGDGNGNPWPHSPARDLDPWDYSNPAGVSQDLIYGKVILRIPLIGWLPTIMKEQGLNNVVIPVVAVIISLLIVIEFVLPLVKRKR